MIIHSPIISGSLSFSNGSTLNAPDGTVLSGSFSGSVSGIGNPETFSSSLSSEISSLQVQTSNIESFTSSINDTVKTKLNTESVISSSIQILGGSTILSSSNQNFTEFSSSVADTFAGLSTNYNDLQNIPTGIVSSSEQIDALFNIDGVVSSSAQIVDVLTSVNSYTASNDTTNTTQNSRLDQLSTETGSINTQQLIQDSRLDQLSTYTASNDSTNTAQNSRLDQLSTETGSISSEQSVQDSRLSNIESFSSSIETAITVDGQNVTVAGNLDVQGTTTTIDSTTVQIGDNILELNGTGAANGGIQVKDATAPNTLTGSLLWDTTNDYWKAGVKGSEIKVLLSEGDGVVSGSEQIVGVLSSINSYTASNDTTNTLQNTRLNQLAAATASYLTTVDISDDTNLAVSDTAQVDMILTGDTLSANLKGGVVSGSAQIVGVLSSINSYTASNDTNQTAQNSRLSNLETFTSSLDASYVTEAELASATGALETTNAAQNVRLNQFATETGSISTEQAVQDARLDYLSSYTASNNTINTGQDSRLDQLSSYTASNDTTNSGQSGRLSSLESFTASLDADLATISLPANTTISTFAKTLLDDTTQGAMQATLGVDPAGTDNSTDVTLAGSYDYLTITGQQITLGQITNDDLLGSIGNDKLSNSSITISGTSVSLGGSITDETLFGGTTLVSGSATQVRSFLNVENGADVTDSTNVVSSLVSATAISAGNKTTIQSNLGVDAAGTDNSTDVTLAGSYDYLTISGQQITRNQITNEDLAGSIANAKLVNSSITISGTSVSLGGSISDETLFGGTGLVSQSNQINLSHLDTDDLGEGSTNLYYTDTRVKTKLTTEQVVSGSATQVRSFLNVEDGADVTDTANVTAAGALMDTELVDLDGIKTLTVPNNTTISTFGASLVDDTTAAAARTTLGVDAAGTDNSTDVTLAGSYDYITISGQTITRNQVDASTDISNLTTSNVSEGSNLYYTDTRVKTKLNAEGVVSGSEQIEDVVGGMVASNTETGITVTYQDADGTIDFAVAYGSSANTAVQGNTNITLNATSGEITIDGSNSQALGGGPTYSIGLADTITGNRTFANNVTVSGNLTVNGTTTTVNSNTVNIGDNILVLNSDETGTPSANGGLEIERGTSTNSTLLWDEGNDYWVAGLAGSEERIVVGAGNTSITTLGTITTGTWNGSVIASAYLDADTAHLSGTQTFSGAKTFSAAVNISNATASTTKTTGALIVTGGVGIGGALNVGGDVVAYASSDERLKDNIELISNPIEKVQSLKGVTWNWNDNADELQQSLPNVGVIAQDVEKVLPQLVHNRDNGFKGVDYAKLTGLLIEAIKEQQKQIDELKSKLG